MKKIRDILGFLSNKRKRDWIASAVNEIEEKGFVNFGKPISMADRELLNKAVEEREEYIGLFTTIPYPDIAEEDEDQGDSNAEIFLQ